MSEKYCSQKVDEKFNKLNHQDDGENLKTNSLGIMLYLDSISFLRQDEVIGFYAKLLDSNSIELLIVWI